MFPADGDPIEVARHRGRRRGRPDRRRRQLPGRLPGRHRRRASASSARPRSAAPIAASVVETKGTQEYVLEREGFLKRLGVGVRRRGSGRGRRRALPRVTWRHRDAQSQHEADLTDSGTFRWVKVLSMSSRDSHGSERRPVGRMKLAVLAVAAVVLSGCSPDADSDLERLALPVAGSDRIAVHLGALARRLDRRAGDLPAGLRPDRLRDDPLPPPQRRRGPGRRSATTCRSRRCTRSRRSSSSRCSSSTRSRRRTTILEQRRQPRPHRRGRRQQVAVGASTTSTKSAAGGEDVFDVGTPEEPDRAVAAGRRVGALRPQVARRHPLVLDPGVLLQDGRRPGQGQLAST